MYYISFLVGLSAFFLSRAIVGLSLNRRRRHLFSKNTVESMLSIPVFYTQGIYGFVLKLLYKNTLNHKQVLPRSFLRYITRRKNTWLDNLLKYSGLQRFVRKDEVASFSAQCAIGISLIFVCFGALFSFIAAGFFFLSGFCLGAFIPAISLKKEALHRQNHVCYELPEMLEVVVLGTTSGLSLERSLALYSNHFDTCLAQEFMFAQQRWRIGVATREEALKAVSDQFESVLCKRAIEAMIRSFQKGTSLTEVFNGLAHESRRTSRTKKEESIAKLPVKMMIPIGTCILPAMLLLVLGPVLLKLF